MIVKYRRWFFLLLLVPFASYAKVTATLDRNQISQYESVNLEISSDTNSDQLPDLSPLKAFFDINSTEKSDSLTVINGDVKRESRWTITLTPKKTGDLSIPALSFGNEKTAPIQLKVTDRPIAQSQSADFFIETTLEPKEAYMEQSVVYTLQIWTSGPLVNASFKPPTLSDNTTLTPIDRENHFRGSRAGRQYEVIEKRYLFSPEKAGTITINPPVLRALAVDNQPFASFYSRSSPESIQLVGKPQTLTIKPKQENWQGTWWLPASRLTLKDEWSRELKNWRVGEPLTRTITVQAWGLAAEKLPDIKMDALTGMNSYPDKSQMDNKIDQHGVVGTRQIKLALVPTQAGEWQLPAVKIAWWNVTTHKAEIAVIPAISVTILPEVGVAPSATIQTPSIVSAEKNQAISSPTLAQKMNTSDFYFWRLLVILLLSLCVLSVIIIVLLLRKLKSAQLQEEKHPQGATQSDQTLKQAIESIKQCCAKNDPRATIDATLSWARIKWVSPHITSLHEVANRIQYPQFTAEVSRLLAACYKQAHSPWDAEQYWKVFQEAIATTTRKNPQVSDDLPPLYG